MIMTAPATEMTHEQFEMQLLENLDAMFCIKHRVNTEVAAAYIKEFRMYQKQNEILKELPVTVILSNVYHRAGSKPVYGMIEDQVIGGYLSLLGYYR